MENHLHYSYNECDLTNHDLQVTKESPPRALTAPSSCNNKKKVCLMMKSAHPLHGVCKNDPISPVATSLSLARPSASVPFFQITTAFVLQLNVQNHTISNTQNTLYLSHTSVSTLLKVHLYSCKFTFISVDRPFCVKLSPSTINPA